ncbi:MAG: ABC transporter ATP-binding protein [Candidatus Omnitrophica bacterium]|nr:ABC transporter ATP-binding protein [Candidatus Omnitrophota bacterium]
MSEKKEKKYSDIEIFRRAIMLSRPYWMHIILIFLLGLLATPLALLVPVPLKIVVDSVIGANPLPKLLSFFIPQAILADKARLLLFAVFMQIAVVLLMQLQSLISYVMQTYTGTRLTLSFRKRLFGHIQRLSFAFHDKRGTSDSIYRIQYDTPSLEYISLYGMIPLVASSLTLVVMVYVIMRINIQLALVALTVTPIVATMSRLYSVRMRPHYTRVKKTESHVLGIIQEVMTAFRVVKAFGREETEEERFEQQSHEAVGQRTWLSFAEGLFGLATNVTTAVGTALVLYIGVRNVQAGAISLGTMLMVISYLAQLYGPLNNVVTKVAGMQSSFASAHRAFELMDEVPDVVEKPHARHIKRARGDIAFKNVYFSYDGTNNVLHDISFEVKAGTRVGIAGRTGAGKSTLVSLMPRFYDPSAGSILIDGIDVRDYRLAELRNQFSIVLQEPVLFAASIRENIAYASPLAHEDQIIDAARAANAHDFIMGLPEKYETLVGERGMRLSGGERQRISLARAFLKNAPILLLDEPTSSVDNATESLIMDAMERLMKNRTTFMIAHRLSTLDTCDIRLEMEEGKIISNNISSPIKG